MTHSMLQTFDVPIRHSTVQAVSVYVYAYSNDTHNVATNVFLTQQLLQYYFFSSSLRPWAWRLSQVWLPNYVRRPCLVNDESFFKMFRHQKVIWPGT